MARSRTGVTMVISGKKMTLYRVVMSAKHTKLAVDDIVILDSKEYRITKIKKSGIPRCDNRLLHLYNSR